MRIELGSRSYDVLIGPDTIDSLERSTTLAGLADANAYALVADRACSATTDRVAAALARTGTPLHRIELDVTEASKSGVVLDELYGRFIDARLNRRSVIVAVGGGVIGDLAGYAAATFVRGVRWVGVPTTLLAAVDSAIGGKVAINHARGKNLIGAIHQPSLVVIDPGTFATLPPREFVSGYGEMLKYGLAMDRRLWDDLIALAPDAVGVAQIERCVARKAAVVAMDERDESGVREVLNFGHTIAHAIEAVTGYGYYRHGEAVVLGMRAALRLSVMRGHCAAVVAEGIDAQLHGVPLPPLPALDADAILAAVHRDKKRAANGNTRFVLLSGLGETLPDDGVTDADIRTAVTMLETACASPS
ncbi:MAG: 3-dehydroquinate synthase [Candidatus Velthaea sp.]